MNDVSLFIKQLEIIPGEPYRKLRITKNADTNPLDLQAGQEQSFFSNKSMVSFASTLSAQFRSDILQSTLLAQLAANKMVPGFDQVQEWHNAFFNVLLKLGWIKEMSDSQTYRSNNTSFEMDNAIIDLLTATFGATYIAIIKKTLTAIKNLGADSNKIEAFKRNTSNLSKGFFQIALANEENGTVAMQLGGFNLGSVSSENKILFFGTQKDGASLDYIYHRVTFNPEAYKVIRDEVNAKLHERLRTDIAEIEI